MKAASLVFLSLLLVGCFPKPDEPAEPIVPERSPVQTVEPPPKKPLDPELSESYVGTYEAVQFLDGKRVENETQPPGVRLWLTMKADSTWLIRNLLSGWSGTWELKNGKIIQTTIEGPAGELKKKEITTLEIKPTQDGVILVTPKENNTWMEFIPDPEIEKKISDAIQMRWKEAGTR